MEGHVAARSILSWVPLCTARAKLLRLLLTLIVGPSAQQFVWAQTAAISPIKAGDTVPFVVVVLRPRGFEATRISVRQTTFIIHIINLSGGTGDPDFTIVTSAAFASSGSAATPVHQSKATKDGTETWSILTLPAGKYVAKMSNHATATLEIGVGQ